MKNHTKVYFEYFNYDCSSWIPCEICGREAVDIMHIIPKGRGGSNSIFNLMAGCRDCHNKNEGINILELQKIHQKYMKQHESLSN